MAYVLNGKKLQVGKAFVDPATSIQYPANWLRLASEADKAAIGVVWEVDPAPVDGRFYWSEGNPKRLEDEPAVDENGDPVLDDDGVQVINYGLKTEWIKKQKEIAGTLLADSDWYVTRKAETDVAIPADVLAYRESVRTISGTREGEINACTTTEELVALLTNPAVVYVEATGAAEPNPEPFITPWPEQD